MKRHSIWIVNMFLAASIILPACAGGGSGGGANPQSSDKAITSFSFTTPPATGTIDESAKTVNITVPEGTDRSALVATFVSTGASVKVGGVEQQSGMTANNFTHPAAYVVAAADSSTATYTVTVAVADVSPGAATLTGATAKTTSIDIAWTNPNAPDLDHVKITWSLNGTTVNTVSVGTGSTSYSITSLITSTEYSIDLATVDAAGNASTPSAFSILTPTSGEKSYSFIYTVDAMNAVHNNLSGNYILMVDLDLNVASFNTGTGWPPVGNSTTPYTGIFNGNRHTIRHLYVAVGSGGPSIGLFGVINDALIYNLSLASVDVTGGGGGLVGSAAHSIITNCSVGGSVYGTNYVGGLIGSASASAVTGCSSTATVVGTAATGGIVGYANSSILNNCTVSGTVSGIAQTGGIAGYVTGTNILNCSAAGGVSGGGANLGGLTGYADTSTLTNCHAAATVIGSSDYDGGLVGYSSHSTLSRCSAAGTVTGSANVGGLVGYNDQSGISESFATGAVAGTAYYVGGLVGYNYYGPVANSFARGAVSGVTMVGGFAGVHECQSSACYVFKSYSTGAVSYNGDTADNGGFVGYDWHGNDVSRSFYDSETSGQSSTGKGEPRATAQMKTVSMYTTDEWDFSNTWSIDNTGAMNNGYPYLRNNTP